MTIQWFEDIGSDDVPQVGGKNASLGEMIGTLKEEDIRVPDGFATTAEAYRRFLEENEIQDRLEKLIDELHRGKALQQVGRSIRKLFQQARFPDTIAGAIREAYRELSRRYAEDETDVAVRSSATAEDLPEASFAGQQETFLNIRGEDDLLDACRRCFASLFTDRALSYREAHGFDHMKVALSVGVQKMVRSDSGGAGVMFTLDPETGFRDVVIINAAWGLGENVVAGTVIPDQYTVFKPLLSKRGLRPIIGKSRGEKEKKRVYAEGGNRTTKNVDTSSKERSAFVLQDEEILKLARWAVSIETHYGKPMDIEWARDGRSGELFIVQARPETVESQKTAQSLKTYTLKEKGERLLSGLSIGQAIAAGKVSRLMSPEQMDRFEEGAVLVTGMTDPDWVPIMKKAAGIITDMGGRTSHAAIVSRELGVPAIVGTGDATDVLTDGQEVTLSCAEGDEGHVYKGTLHYEEHEVDLEAVPKTRTRIMMNIASPAGAFRWWRLPCEGIGLARMEFIINHVIRIHPMALLHPERVEDAGERAQIESLTRGFESKSEYFISHLAQGIAKIAASQFPHDVIVRMSDFKSNEYANLIGGKAFEPHENNPMLGFRGASRYYSERYRDGFALECRAVRRAREQIGMHNIQIMIPFCRTPAEADKVLAVLAENGLKRAENGLRVYVMCEIPSNVILADEFSKRFDGFSIGSNDLTQLVMGVGRDAEELAELFDQRNEAVKRMIRHLIPEAHRFGRKVGICGQAPSDYPEFAAFLVREGIDSISLNPDSVIPVKKRVAEVERESS
ncbi:MAG: phosphoenolpyruvate synthase [Desulfobacteraceae bacterium]|nr:MAG: phosphoenolpyruvate synthase [Desulfobacteraceae bacterium]